MTEIRIVNSEFYLDVLIPVFKAMRWRPVGQDAVSIPPDKVTVSPLMDGVTGLPVDEVKARSLIDVLDRVWRAGKKSTADEPEDRAAEELEVLSIHVANVPFMNRLLPCFKAIGWTCPRYEFMPGGFIKITKLIKDSGESATDYEAVSMINALLDNWRAPGATCIGNA